MHFNNGLLYYEGKLKAGNGNQCYKLSMGLYVFFGGDVSSGSVTSHVHLH